MQITKNTCNYTGVHFYLDVFSMFLAVRGSVRFTGGVVLYTAEQNQILSPARLETWGQLCNLWKLPSCENAKQISDTTCH